MGWRDPDQKNCIQSYREPLKLLAVWFDNFLSFWLFLSVKNLEKFSEKRERHRCVLHNAFLLLQHLFSFGSLWNHHMFASLSSSVIIIPRQIPCISFLDLAT